jgi:hypothetical protein
MKQTTFFIALLIFVLFTKTNAQKYGLDNTDPSVFTNFKIPDSDLRSLWFNTNLNIQTNKNNHVYPGPDASNSRADYNSDFRFNLNPRFFLLKESDDRMLLINADMTGTYNHNYSESNSLGQPATNSRTNNYTAIINLNLNYNNYINSGNVFYSAGSTDRVVLNDSKGESNYFTPLKEYNGFKSQSYTFSLGAGIGKLRNVTPVVTAVRFQERLKQVNLLDKDLSNKTIEDLAGQFYKQSYYNSVYNRPDKYFWQDMDKILANDEVSLKDMNMYSDAYLRESVNEVRFLRNEGFVAGLNLQLNYQNQYTASNQGYYLSEQLFAMGQAYINFSHQMNLNSQLNFNLSLSGGPDVIAHPSERQQYSMAAGLGYDYELTDRLVASVNNTFYLLFGNYVVQQKLLSNYFNINMKYFVEDNLSLNIDYNWTYSDSKGPYYSSDRNIINTHSINIGFSYYIETGPLFNESSAMFSTAITHLAPILVGYTLD